MKIILILAMLFFVIGCNRESNETTLNNGQILLENNLYGTITISKVEIDGHSYIVVHGIKKTAICPSAETLKWANQPNQ